MPKKRAARLASEFQLQKNGCNGTSTSSNDGNYYNKNDKVIGESSSFASLTPTASVDSFDDDYHNVTSNNNATTTKGRGSSRMYALCLIFVGTLLGLYNMYESLGLSPDLDDNNRGVGMMRSTAANNNNNHTSVTTTTTTPEIKEDTPHQHHDDDSDQYSRLLSQPTNLQSLRAELSTKWISYAQTPPQQQQYFIQVYECTQRFQDSAYVHDGLNTSSFVYRDAPVFGSGSRVLEAFVAGDSSSALFSSQASIQQLVSQLHNMLFAGDAIVKQQYFFLVCGLNPQIQTTDFAVYQETHGINTHFQYDYKHSATSKVTKLRYEEVGRLWNNEMHELWYEAVPKAVGSFGPKDVIVLDSSRQFDVKDISEYEKVLQFVKQKAFEAKATIYYMEPTPQEYPTSNGYNIGPLQQMCAWKCQCQMLTDATLQGNAKPYDPAFVPADGTTEGTGLDMTSPATLAHRTSIADLTSSTVIEPFAKLYGHDRAAKFTTQASEQEESCLPNCVPATWQIDLVRSVLLQQQEANNHKSSNNNLQVVPTYWQLVGRNQPSSAVMRGDCTHRGPDAVVFMNQQLLRSIQNRDAFYAAEEGSSSNGSTPSAEASTLVDAATSTTDSNSAVNSAPQSSLSTTELEHQDVDTNNIDVPVLQNACGVLDQPSNLQMLRQQMKSNWISYQQTPKQQQDYFLKVYNCGLRYKSAYVNSGLNTISFLYRDAPVFGTGSRTLDAMRCSKDAEQVTQTKLQQLVSKRNNMLFAGDSVLKQQYFIFVCMVEPNAQIKDFTVYDETSGMGSRFRYDYNRTEVAMDPNTGGVITKSTTTSIRYEAIGKVWNKEMHELWWEAFPKAVASFSQQDIIVMDSSRHFNTLDIEEFETVLRFIKTKATEAKASIYYMEPTPQEWPTSNGLHIATCSWICQCQTLSDLSLQGTAKPYDAAQIEGVDLMVSNETTFRRTAIADLTTTLVEPFSKLYGHDRAATFTKQATEEDLSCLPDCVPATWRVDLVRSIILPQQEEEQQQRTILSSSNNNNLNNLHLVPIYWQLVGRSQHSSMMMKGDCTHRGIDAVAFMNEQLIRSIQRS